MAITYNAGTNIITVTAYTEAVPANFTDIYNADKAGTLSLHARTGITGTDGAGVAVDRAERPADYIVLGGASNDLYITIANWNGTTATIRITGTDRDGAAQTEDIVVNANGTYYTTKWFKTITHTQVTAFTATSFDYDLTQGQWGVVARQCTGHFCFDCKLVIGNGSTVSWFADIDKQIIMQAGVITVDWHIFIELKQYGNFRCGYLKNAANKATTGGCYFFIEDTGHYMGMIKATASDTDIKLYGCCFINDSHESYECVIHTQYGNGTLYNCLLNNVGLRGDPSGTWDVNRIDITEGMYGLNRMVAGTFNDIILYGNSYGIYTQLTQNLTLRNSSVKGAIYYPIRVYKISTHKYFIDCDITWNIQWLDTSTHYLYRQYSFDLKVIDKDNVTIDGATVKVWDKDSNLIIDTTTNASGVIATQTITRGTYAQATGNTLQEKSPHLIKIEKAGYTTYEADFTLEDKTDWTIALQTSILRNPSMSGGMV
jgi:hypothetical protein